MNAIAPRTPAEEALGVALPHRRMEDWKWTDLRRLITTPYEKNEAAKPLTSDVDRIFVAAPLAALKAQRIVFVNGVFDAARSQLAAVANTASSTISDGDSIIAISNQLKAEGVALHLEGNVDTPIEILHLSTNAAPRAMGVRHRIDVAAGAVATVIESHVGEGDYLATSVVEITVGEGARLDRVKIEAESEKATHLSHVMVSLAKGAVLRDFTLTSGAALNRQNGTYVFTGQGADAKISGTYLLSGKQHADTQLVVDHAVPHCVSRELYKVVMDDHARGIFQGKVIVRPHAQKTDGKQSSHALLLSETAEFDAKPELEIYADDVVCGHGATSGDLNQDHLFYLMSRGIPKAEARSLLVAAFVGEAIETVEHEGLRDALLLFAAQRLAK